MLTASQLPMIIQGGMGVAVSSWPLARAVARCGQLGVVSGTALDLVLARRLQDGDEGGHLRRALAHFPDQDVVTRALDRYFLEGGRAPGESYAPLLKLTLMPTRSVQELVILGGFAEVWLAKEGHAGPIGINCLEKIQLATPATIYGAMLAGVDVVLMGAGVPRAIPHLLDELAIHATVQFPIDVADAGDSEHHLDFAPRELVDSGTPALQRPVFIAIVSAHALATYLARDPQIRPDGFVVEAPNAGGHNAPPRQRVIDDQGDLVFGPRDEPDLAKIAMAGLPYWIAGGSGTPETLAAAVGGGAHGIQVGTVFALSSDSGLDPDVRAQLREGIRTDSLVVHTDPVASPTGFPFKVVEVDGTMSDDTSYQARERLCDLGFLRTPYIKATATPGSAARPGSDEESPAAGTRSIGYRCAGEPEHMFVRKGGEADDAVGRKCLCNGLAAAVGLGQQRPDGYVELPIVTLGSDLQAPRRMLADHPQGWTAAEAIEWILGSMVPASSGPS